MKLYAVWEMKSGKGTRKIATLYGESKEEVMESVKISNPEVKKKDMFLVIEGGQLDKNLKTSWH